MKKFCASCLSELFCAFLYLLLLQSTESFSLPSKPSLKDLLCSCVIITYFETAIVFCIQVKLFDGFLSSLLICCCVCCFNDGQIVTDPLHGKCVDVCLV